MTSPTQSSMEKAREVIKELNDCIVMQDAPSPGDWAEVLDSHAEEIIALLLDTQRQGVLEEIRNLVLDDVPHQYQKRLLEALHGT